MIVLSCIVYLARQGLPLRGHIEEEGNLFQLLKFRAMSEVPRLNEWLRNRCYLSHDIVNEIVRLMANNVLRSLIKTVEASGFYSILADETRDRSNKEQLVVCVRWVDADFCVYEEPLGLFNVPDTTRTTLFTAIVGMIVGCLLLHVFLYRK